MKKKIFLLLLICLPFVNFSQELNCKVDINRGQIQGTNVEVFQSLRNDLYEFLNNKKWTNNVFAVNERIDCRIMINLTKYNGIDKFTGTISVQTNRPIYNTNYKSILLNHKEKDGQFQFDYVEGQTLEFNENTHISNLTSVLAFYAYLIIGLDYDSFGMMSGTPYFRKAQQIVNNAQSAPEPGWRAYESSSEDNRYYLIENILNNTNSPLRRFYYSYHRLGLDVMTEKTEIGRAEINNSFNMMQKVFRRKPDSFFLKIILTTKLDEIVNIYSEAPQSEKKKVYNILKEIDPSSSKIDKIMSRKNNK